jgi:hypothetical protein
MLSWLTLHSYPLVQRDAVYFVAKAESGLRTDAVSPRGNIGLFQFGGARRQRLIAYAHAHAKLWTDLQVQLEFMDEEWRLMPASRAFFAAADRATAMRLFCRHYEGSIC